MNIALVSDYSITDYLSYGFENNWSTPKGIFTELLKSEKVTNVKWYPFPEEKDNYPFIELQREINRNIFLPDILFYMSCGPRKDNMFSKKYFPNTKLVVDMGDEPQTRGFNINRARHADLILTPDYECFKKYESEGYNAIHTGHWADMEVYYPDNSKEKIHSVVSSMKGNRKGVDKYLEKKLKNKFVNKINLSAEENADLYRSSKIVFQKSRYNEITRRIFEGMATRRLVVADRLPYEKKLNYFFEDGKDIVLYECKREAFQKIKYYLKNDDERERIASNGYEKVKNLFNTKNIIEYVL